MSGAPRVRKDITKLSQDELTTLVRAWKGIQEKTPDDPDSFFKIAGYHGMPFRGAGWGNSQWWGGYCHHGNILFPTWHRAYVYRIEEALRTVAGCENVTMAYWNEPASPDKPGFAVVPEIFTSPFFKLDGIEIPNPLYSYKFAKGIVDNIATIDTNNAYNYSKPGLWDGAPSEYTTVRYPQSGLVGTKDDFNRTTVQNLAYKDPIRNAQLLNDNIRIWLDQDTFVNDKGDTVKAGTRKKFCSCLQAPNYTVFSNNTSATEWNHNQGPHEPAAVALESPHNDMHLAIGGFEASFYDRDIIAGAQGDMGENDTASFDPIFFFHHCWIDNVFWQWQVKHDADPAPNGNTRNKLTIIDAYPGTNSVDSQGPTPGIAGGSWLTLDTPLEPFKNPAASDPKQPYYTSNDVVNIETSLGYTYDNTTPLTELLGEVPAAPVVAHISGINKRDIRGSFNVGVFGTVAGKEQLLGQESILSRWHMEGCENCQLHTEVSRYIPLHGVTPEHVDKSEFKGTVSVFTREDWRKKNVKLYPKLRIIKKHV